MALPESELKGNGKYDLNLQRKEKGETNGL